MSEISTEKEVGMTFICAIEGDRGTPVRFAKGYDHRPDKDEIREFVNEWAEGYGLDDDDEVSEIVTGLLNDGDRWWWDELWCFQIVRDVPVQK